VYYIDASQILYKKTRRGVNAKVQIQRRGKAIATLYDVAEEISAKVDFISDHERKLFLKAAMKDEPHSNERFAISQYARKITMKVEQALLEEQQLNTKIQSLIAKKKQLDAEFQQAITEVTADIAGECSSMILNDLVGKTLSVRVGNAVNYLGFTTIADIVKHSRNELKCMPGLGSKAIDELEALVNSVGMALKQPR
jgi:hypothetical protein